ncbi:MULTISPECIES: hypothetical protein, partial [Serratia]
MAEQSNNQFTHYRQVKNPNPEFTPREGKNT